MFNKRLEEKYQELSGRVYDLSAYINTLQNEVHELRQGPNIDIWSRGVVLKMPLAKAVKQILDHLGIRIEKTYGDPYKVVKVVE